MDAERYVRWCARQKRGIRMIEPSECLGEQYAEKSREAVLSMKANAMFGLADWAVSASYYAMYYAVYSLFIRAGIKCEIHDCTAALFGHLFGDAPAGDGSGRDLADMLTKSKKNRVAAQYYPTDKDRPLVDLDGLAADTCRFVAAVGAISDGLDSGRIGEIRARLKKAIG